MEAVFEDFHGPVEIGEDVAIGTAISAISATDSDVGYGGLVRYSLWDDYFSIDSATGVIRVAGDLSELLSPGTASVPHDLEILASDEGSPRKSSKTTVKVLIKDVNNNAPEFEEPQNHEVLDSDEVRINVRTTAAKEKPNESDD
ncbi:cadherin domain protein [Cooperia oncophora]